jgi:hypothetical protein
MDGIKRNVPTITKATHGTNIKTKSKRIPKTDATREIVAPLSRRLCVALYRLRSWSFVGRFALDSDSFLSSLLSMAFWRQFFKPLALAPNR